MVEADNKQLQNSAVVDIGPGPFGLIAVDRACRGVGARRYSIECQVKVLAGIWSTLHNDHI